VYSFYSPSATVYQISDRARAAGLARDPEADAKAIEAVGGGEQVALP
jgi:hypothetical protein